MRILLALLFTLLNIGFLQAQEPEVFENKIYKNNLRTVQFHLNNSPISYPIVNLNASDNTLQLYFDDVDSEVKDYTYTIQLCDKDWTAANLSEMDYLEGFTEADIREFDFSQRVQTNFIHYTFTFPNQDIRWTKSGNYILKVYEDMGRGEKDLVITRRFMVIESLGKIQENIAYPSRTDLQQTHQEIDFKLILNQGVEVQNPVKEISAAVLQNGRWDNAIMNIQPMLYRGNSISFDYQNKIIFPAGKEWRPLDIRSFNQRSGNVAEIVELEDGVDLILKTDKKRTYKAHHSRIDIEGRYVIQNFDLPQRLQQSNSILNLGNTNTDTTEDDVFNSLDFTEEDNLQSDYALVYFSLDSPTEYDNGDLYIFGGLSNWEINPEFKLEYDRKNFVYHAEVWLKQGYYDYMYAFIPHDEPTKIDLETLEGNWYETDNQYTIVVYYRPAGERYDRIISVWHPYTRR